MDNLIKRLLLTASLTMVLPVTASAANVAFHCKVDSFFNPFVDKTDKNSVAYDKLQQKEAVAGFVCTGIGAG